MVLFNQFPHCPFGPVYLNVSLFFYVPDYFGRVCGRKAVMGVVLATGTTNKVNYDVRVLTAGIGHPIAFWWLKGE